MADVSDLRADVRRLRRLAGKKISRQRVFNKAELSGTKYDPRRSLGVEKKYNTRQLLAYQRELKSFLSRRNQFVGGYDQLPIPRVKWQKYKQLETNFNDQINAHFQSVKDVRLPIGDETLGQRMAKITPDHRYMRGSAVNSAYDPIVREPKMIRGEEKLDKLTKKYEDKPAPEYLAEKVDQGRDVFRKMAERVGDMELAERVLCLPDTQFQLLWDYTPFVRDFSFDYEYYKWLHLKENNLPIPPGMPGSVKKKAAEDHRAEYHRLVNWAEKLQVPDGAQVIFNARTKSKKTKNR